MPCQISKRNNSAYAILFAQDIQGENILSLCLIQDFKNWQKEYGGYEDYIFGPSSVWKKG